MDLKTPLVSLTGIGPSLAYRLTRLGLLSVENLIYHFPFRYDDFSQSTTIQDAQVGQIVTLQGEIWSIKNIYTRSRKILTQAIFNDGSSPIILTWFNSSWLTKQIKTGDRLQVSGKLTKYKSKLSIMAPAWELITSEEPKLTSEVSGKNLVPIYPETYGVSSKWLRTKIAAILPQVKVIDPLPNEIKNNMLALPDALQKIHFPQN